MQIKTFANRNANLSIRPALVRAGGIPRPRRLAYAEEAAVLFR